MFLIYLKVDFKLNLIKKAFKGIDEKAITMVRGNEWMVEKVRIYQIVMFLFIFKIKKV
jgi:hypothetical protein